MNNNIQNLNIVRLGKHNLADMARLHYSVYGKKPVPHFFTKKYNTAYTGTVYIGYIAYDAGLPIAYYGVIPCFIKCDNQVILSAQSADTMTHPEYRNKGLFVDLARRTYNLCRQNGINFIFGFPNQNSLPGFIHKLGWRVIENMNRFVIPVKAIPLERVCLRLGLKKAYQKYTHWILSTRLLPQKGLENQVFHDGFCGVFRDNEYLNYKSYNPTQVIKLGRAVAWVKIANGLIIGDMQLQPNDFNVVIGELKKLARKLGVTHIQFHTSPGTQLHRLFAGRYGAIPSFPVIIKDLDQARQQILPKIKFTLADIDIF